MVCFSSRLDLAIKDYSRGGASLGENRLFEIKWGGEQRPFKYIRCCCLVLQLKATARAVAIHGWNGEMGDRLRLRRLWSWDLIIALLLMLWLQLRERRRRASPTDFNESNCLLSFFFGFGRPSTVVGRLDYTNRSILVWNEGVCARLFHQSLEMSSTGSVAARELLQQQQ